MLGSGNLGLVYLLDERRRLTLEEIDAQHPRLVPALREHPHVGWLLIRSERARPARARPARHALPRDRRVDGEDPLAQFSAERGEPPLRGATASPTSPTSWSAASTTRRSTKGCAFEELISFHGGLGGPQTRPFLLYPAGCPRPTEPIVGAASVNEILLGWRHDLQGDLQEVTGRGAGGSTHLTTAPRRRPRRRRPRSSC